MGLILVFSSITYVPSWTKTSNVLLETQLKQISFFYVLSHIYYRLLKKGCVYLSAEGREVLFWIQLRDEMKGEMLR